MVEVASKLRSPRYPVIGLREAIEKARAVYQKDGRNKIPKALVAEHMGYGGLNGKSLGIIAAVTKYGLIEGGRDAMWVTIRAVSILERELGDPERIEAVREAASLPDLYKDIQQNFPGPASDAAIRSFLVTKRAFLRESAERLVRSYRETQQLVEEESEGYETGSSEQEPESMEAQSEATSSPTPSGGLSFIAKVKGLAAAQVQGTERELTTGLLSKGASYRLIVSGKIGKKEIETLIKKLQIDMELLADADEVSAADDNYVD